MKTRHLLLLLIAAFSIGSANAMDEADARALFTEANTAYEAGDFESALQLYDSVAVNFSSFELWFNAGNAAYRSGKIGKSILYYERAKRISPANDDLLVNMAIANERVADRIAELPSLGVEDLLGVLTSTSRLGTWSWLALALNLLGFGLLAGWVFAARVSFKRSLATLGITFIFLGLLSYAMARATHSRILANTEAIILVPKIEVKNGPAENESNAFLLHEGTKVKIQQELGNWFEIRLANGAVGWISADALEVI